MRCLATLAVFILMVASLVEASITRAPKEGWGVVLDGGVADSCVPIDGNAYGCGPGKRMSKVVCLKEWREVTDADDIANLCPDENKPDATSEACNVTCVLVGDEGLVVEPLLESYLERRVDTVSACIALASPSDATSGHITRCLLSPGRYEEHGIDLAGKQDLVIESLHNNQDGEPVVFDGTDLLDFNLVTEYKFLRQVRSKDKTVQAGLSKPSGVYWIPLERWQAAGYNITKIENFIVDGVAIQKAYTDYNTARQPCFEYDATTGDQALPRPFSCGFADEFYLLEDWESSLWASADDEASTFFKPSKFWLDTTRERLYVYAPGLHPRIRIKNPQRQTAFVASKEGSGAKNIEIKNLHFLGSSISIRGPASKKFHSMIAVKGCRFLFSAPKSIEVETTTKRGRGAGEPIDITDNVLEFGEGALWYVASGATLKRNLLVGNAFADRPYYSFHSISQADNLDDNTCLYEGSNGGHLSFSHSNEARRNLWLGQSFLSKWHDNAVHHAFTNSQTNLVISDSWFLGPSLIKSVRLDTAKSTTEPGTRTTIRNNIFLGLEPLTVKGDEHRFEHNTGDRCTMVEAWQSLANQNAESWFRFNAVGKWGTRGSTQEGVAPGHSELNACHDLRVCNGKNNTLPSFLGAQFQAGGPKRIPLIAGTDRHDICSLLNRCFIESNSTIYDIRASFDTGIATDQIGLAKYDEFMGSAGGQTAMEKTNEFEVQWKLLRLSQDGLTPESAHSQMLSHEQVRNLDFRPTESAPPSAPLVIDCSSASKVDCSGYGFVVGFGSGAQETDKYSNFIGAYDPSEPRPDPPGCYFSAKPPGSRACSRTKFPYEFKRTGEVSKGNGESGASSTMVSTVNFLLAFATVLFFL